MSKYKAPNQGEYLVGVIVGGDSEDAPKDKAGGARVWIPSLYNGNKIKFTDLPFARMIGAGTQGSVHSSSHPPERGTCVMCVKDGGPGHSGTGYVTILGVLPNTVMKGMGVPGGKSLFNFFEEAVNHKTDKKAPPKSLKNGSRDGAEIREVQDNGMWSHSLVKAIPSTATLWPMAGIHLDQVKGIATATQHSTSILSSSMLSQMPGMTMSLGKMFNMLQSTGALDQILSKLPPEIKDAMVSTSNLITQVETSSSYGFAVTNRVQPDTFLQNATELLSTATSIGDIVDTMNRLTTDESLHGLDKLEKVKIRTSGAYGNTIMELDSTGSLTATINLAEVVASVNTDANAVTTIANVANTIIKKTGNKQDDDDAEQYVSNIQGAISMLTSAEQAFSSSGKNLFGESAKTMFDMHNRMNPGKLAHMKQLTESVNTGITAKKNIKPLTDLIMKGGNILSGKGFS